MKIRYSERRLKIHLRMGAFFILLGLLLSLISIVTESWNGFSLLLWGIAQIGAGICMCLLYYFENRNQYLTLKNGELIKHSFFPKKLMLADIKSLQEIAGDLKVSHAKGEVVIDTRIIEPESLVTLKDELKKFGLL